MRPTKTSGGGLGRWLPLFLLPAVAFKMAAAQPAGTYPPADQPAAVVDDILFGDGLSEQNHGLKAEESETFRGGLDQPARKLLPGGSHPWEGGTLEWTMKIDPEAQNYVTVKLWGSDQGQASGRLVLFANGLQVGYRNQEDYDILNQCDEEPLAPGRFVYVTLPLPPKLTLGKTSLDLKIVSLGPIWYYGSTFEQEQKALAQPTRGIYSAYTHIAPRFAPAASEKQGEMPAAGMRSTPGKEVISESEDIVKDRLTKLLAAKTSPRDMRALYAELLLLGEAYNTRWTPAYQNPKVIDQIVRDGDAMAEDFASERKDVEASSSWPGAGPLGRAIMRTWPAVGNRLDVPVNLGSTEMPRKEAWANTLQQSVDYWRTHRRAYTNQSMIVDMNIYTANRALSLLIPAALCPKPGRCNTYTRPRASSRGWGATCRVAAARCLMESTITSSPARGSHVNSVMWAPTAKQSFRLHAIWLCLPVMKSSATSSESFRTRGCISVTPGSILTVIAA